MLPSDVTTITVTATYLNMQGEVQSGSVAFTPQNVAAFRVPSDGVFLEPEATTVQLDDTGSISVVLPVTDAMVLSPEPFSYGVTENILGMPARSYSVDLPSELGATVSLAAVAPSSASNPVAPVQVSQGGSGATSAAGAPWLLKTGGTVAGELSPTVTPLVFGSTVEVDATAGNVFSLVMTGPCTLAGPTGGTDGQAIRIRVTSNGHALSYGAAYRFGTAGEPDLSTSGMDLLGFEYVAVLSAWVFLGGGGQAFGA